MRPIRFSLLSAIASFSLIFGLASAGPPLATPEAGGASPGARKGIELRPLELALPPSARDLQAKSEECQICHQPSGQGFHGVPPVPRLAGQQIEYFVNQLRAFIEHRRVHPIMGNVAQFLSPSDAKGTCRAFQGAQSRSHWRRFNRNRS